MNTSPLATMNSSSTTMNTSSSNSFRSWKKDGPPSFSTNSSDAAPPARPSGFQGNNAFARMSRDKQDRMRAAPGLSYADHKRKLEEEAKEKEKNRPLTDADFPTLGGGPLVTKVKSATTTSSLANHIAETIKRDEETLARRKREEEEAREKAAAEAGIVRLPLFKTMKEYVEWKNNGGLKLPPVELPPARRVKSFYQIDIDFEEPFDDDDNYHRHGMARSDF